MKLLNDIPTKYFVGIDIETVRKTENYEDLPEEWKSAWKYKNKQDGEVPPDEILAELWTKTASLYAEFSKVCAVSLAFLNKDESKLKVKEFFGEDEIKILTDLAIYLNRMSANSKEYRLLGHAAKYFDYPFLGKRYVVNNLSIPTILDTAHQKPWETKNMCTNQDIWKMGGTGAGSSLQALCTVLAIPISKVDLVGDEVGSAYFRGEHSRIGRYCSMDTIATFNVVRRIKQEHVFSFEEAEYIEDDVIPEQPPVLQRLYMTGNFSEEIQQEISALIKKSNLDLNDKENIKDIILAHYIAKGDKVAVKKEKTQEINTFINTL